MMYSMCAIIPTIKSLNLSLAIMLSFITTVLEYKIEESNLYLLLLQARNQGFGRFSKPPSQIEGPLFYKKIHYLQIKSLLFY